METLIKFKQFVDEITKENGRNYKIATLEKYKDDEDIRYYLNFLFNPYITTGISTKKLNKELSILVNFNFYTIRQFLDYLKENNTGADVNIYITQCFRSQCNFDPVLDGIITKNLPLGIDAKTINKVIPGLIPEFNVMLANKYFDKPEVVEGKEFVITTKIDGMRCIMLKENGNVTFWSRQGQPIEGLVDLEKEAERFPDNICLDGELIAKETTLEDTYKNTMKTARTKDLEKHNLKMMVFDYMPVEDFKTQYCDLKYTDRRNYLRDIFIKDDFLDFCAKRYPAGLFDCLTPEESAWSFEQDEAAYVRNRFNYFEILPILYKGADISKIIYWLNNQTDAGQEGIMINICDAEYSFSRTNALLKCKNFQDTELEIIGFEEGTNRNKGRLGALKCKYKDNVVDVGSGFSDELRTNIWEHKEDWLGKIITVKYFETSVDSKTGLESLRFPIFMRIREDYTV